jgi:glycosyltransferase involved in cell wall biosynthesis
MARVLIVLPYSGRAFGGGLSVFNAELTKALSESGHDVRLLTMELPNYTETQVNPIQKEHGSAKLLQFKNQQASSLNYRSDEGRDVLYDVMNHETVILDDNVISLITAGNWEPEIIIGHSRFSGPAAILLKTNFPKAKTAYFLHSIPVEGTALVGYEAYGEAISPVSAKRKIAKEKEWMTRANVVIAVGPLIRAGAVWMLDGAPARIHECIGGTVVDDSQPVTYKKRDLDGPALNLLFLGRINTPIKGLEDLLLAALALKGKKYNIDVRYWEDRTYPIADKDIKNETKIWVTKKGDKSYTVQGTDVKAFVDELLGSEDSRAIRVNILGKTENVKDEVRKYDALLMPSYMEHFGLVPFDALAVGVPVLVNQLSGAAMFLGDAARFQGHGVSSIVQDFYKHDPLKPSDYFEDVPKDAFDNRPVAWAKAIEGLEADLETRFADAAFLRKELQKFTWKDCAKGCVAAILEFDEGFITTVQGASGSVIKVS